MPKRTVYLTPPSLLWGETVWGKLLPRPWRHSGKAGSCCGVAWREGRRKEGRESRERERKGGVMNQGERNGWKSGRRKEEKKRGFKKKKSTRKEPMRGKRRAAGEREERKCDSEQEEARKGDRERERGERGKV